MAFAWALLIRPVPAGLIARLLHLLLLLPPPLLLPPATEAAAAGEAARDAWGPLGVSQLNMASVDSCPGVKGESSHCPQLLQPGCAYNWVLLRQLL
jgi:hypothetical protein